MVRNVTYSATGGARRAVADPALVAEAELAIRTGSARALHIYVTSVARIENVRNSRTQRSEYICRCRIIHHHRSTGNAPC